MPELPGAHTGNGLHGLVQVGQVAVQGVLDLLSPVPAGHLAARAFQHDKGIQGVAVGGGDDPGVMDVEAQLVQRPHAAREDIVVIVHVDEYLGAAAVRHLPDQDQGQALFR